LDDTKQILIKVRGNSEMRIAWLVTETATNYITVPRGSVYTRENLSLIDATVFIFTDLASVVEIEEWK